MLQLAFLLPCLFILASIAEAETACDFAEYKPMRMSHFDRLATDKVEPVTRLINPGINFHSAHSSARRKARKIPHNPAIKRRIDCGTLVNPFHV
jgi:hypothetical protein